MAGFNVKDIVGLGEVVGHLKDLLLKIIETISTREERRLRNQNSRLENTSKLLDIAREHDLSPERLKYYEELANGHYPARTRKGFNPCPTCMRAIPQSPAAIKQD